MNILLLWVHRDQIKRQKNGRVKKKKAVHSYVESSLLVTQSLPNVVHSLKGDEDGRSRHVIS